MVFWLIMLAAKISRKKCKAFRTFNFHLYNSPFAFCHFNLAMK